MAHTTARLWKVIGKRSGCGRRPSNGTTRSQVSEPRETKPIHRGLRLRRRRSRRRVVQSGSIQKLQGSLVRKVMMDSTGTVMSQSALDLVHQVFNPPTVESRLAAKRRGADCMSAELTSNPVVSKSSQYSARSPGPQPRSRSQSPA